MVNLYKYLDNKPYLINKGFTLIEILIVIVIIIVISMFVLTSVKNWRDKINLGTTTTNLKTLDTALKIYIVDHDGAYPPDENRDIPPQLVNQLQNKDWKKPAWENSVYDWDNWNDPVTGEKIYQFSVRFCLYGDPDSCNFPDFIWARNFDYYSSVYYCVSGPCRSHISQPINHPGFCVNCD